MKKSRILALVHYFLNASYIYNHKYRPACNVLIPASNKAPHSFFSTDSMRMGIGGGKVEKLMDWDTEFKRENKSHAHK